MIRVSDMLSGFLAQYKKQAQTPREQLLTDIPVQLDNTQHKMNILLAQPSVGKSAFLIQTAAELARQGVHFIIFSYEMAETVILTRLISNLAQLRKKDIENATVEYGVIESVIRDNIDIFAHINISFAGAEKEIRRDIESLYRDPDITELRLALGFDYLQKMTAKDASDPRMKVERNLTFISKLVFDYTCMSFVISSTNRNGYESNAMDAGRDSGQIEYDADTITTLKLVRLNEKKATWELIKKDEIAVEQEKPKVYVKVSTHKNRHGETASKVMIFDKTIQKFFPLTTDTYTYSGTKGEAHEDPLGIF